MLQLILLSNLRLAIYLFGALVFASMSWLYFDAMAVRMHKSVIARGCGALLIALSYLSGAVVVEGVSMAWISGVSRGIFWTRIIGYLVLALGVWGEPLSKRPGSENIKKAHLQILTITNLGLDWLMPVMPAFVGLGYWRRASVGLERHLKAMAYGMYVLSIAELLDMRKMFTEFSDVRLYDLVRDYGYLWIAQILVMLIGLLLVSRWVFSYLLRRFETQITLFMGMLVLAVFTISTLVFTYIMANRLEDGALREATAAAKITRNNWSREADHLKNYAQELMTIDIKDKEKLAKELESGSQILDSDGRDVITGLKDENLKEGVGYEIVGVGNSRSIKLSVKLKRSDGWVVVTRNIDSDFLEKSAIEIGMAIRVYDNDTVVVASTIPGYDLIPSPVGLKRIHGNRLGGVAYTSTTLPLEDPENIPVALLEIATPQAKLWESVAQALFWTYLVGVGVLILLELPAILIARYLTKQIR